MQTYRPSRNRTAARASHLAAAFITGGGINCGNAPAVACAATYIARSPKAVASLRALTLVQQMLAIQHAAWCAGNPGVCYAAVPRVARPLANALYASVAMP